MDGWWDCDAARRAGAPRPERRPRRAPGRRPTTLARVAQAKVINLQSRRRAFQIGERHYDIGNDLYRRMLDSRMIYSCGYWRNADTLDAAQEAKLDLIATSSSSKPACACSTSAAAGAAPPSSSPRSSGARWSASPCHASRPRSRASAAPGCRSRSACRTTASSTSRSTASTRSACSSTSASRTTATYMDVVRRCLRDPDGLSLLHTIGGAALAQPDRSVDREVHLPQLDAAVDGADRRALPRAVS